MRTLLRIAIVAAVVSIASVSGAASAHEQRTVGPLKFVVGWESEPAYAGSVNAVTVQVERNGDAVTGVDLRAVVIFGDRNATTRSSALDLQAGDAAGHHSAAIVPSRPGTYTIHVTGTASGANIDEFFTSGEDTFDDVKDPAVIAFPARDPSAPQLASRLDRSEDKVQNLQSRSTIALVVGGLGLLIGIVALVTRRRRA